MRVLHISSELYPLLKTGGLADVVSALPLALNQFNCESRILLPAFPALWDKGLNKQLIKQIPQLMGVMDIQVYLVDFADYPLPVYLIKHDELYYRQGNPYLDEHNQAYADDYLRFAILAWIGAQLAYGLDQQWLPEVIHGHDWHSGLTFAYLHYLQYEHGLAKVTSVYTVHNLAYQGVFSYDKFSQLNLPNSFFDMYGLEFHGKISYLKAGLYFADKITTVSPSYAKEITTFEHGCGLHGLLNWRSADLLGILNGIDEQVWNPLSDNLLASNYGRSSLKNKLICKYALQEHYGLVQQNDFPLFVIVSRLTEQKGLHLVLQAISQILTAGGQLVVLGSGDIGLEQEFQLLAQANPQQIALQLGYDEQQAHRLIAAGDVILVPSRFEPCGLTQLYGLKYGTLPLVRAVGGLADTVTDCSLENLADNSATGFVFKEFNLHDFATAIRRAFALFNRKSDWRKVQINAMQQNHSWFESAKQYANLYQQIKH